MIAKETKPPRSGEAKINEIHFVKSVKNCLLRNIGVIRHCSLVVQSRSVESVKANVSTKCPARTYAAGMFSLHQLICPGALSAEGVLHRSLWTPSSPQELLQNPAQKYLVVPRTTGSATGTGSELSPSVNTQHALLRASSVCLGLRAEVTSQSSTARSDSPLFCECAWKAAAKENPEQNVRISWENLRYWLEGFRFPTPSVLYGMILRRWSRFHPRGEATATHGFPERRCQLPLCKLNIAYQLLTFRKRWLQSICDVTVKLDENSEST